ncbi:hypothetical protein BOX15_Mlig021188g2, partial [Macrostomum lignano]
YLLLLFLLFKMLNYLMSASRASKLTFLASLAFTGFSVSFVLWTQKSERDAVKQGVLADIERQKLYEETLQKRAA